MVSVAAPMFPRFYWNCLPALPGLGPLPLFLSQLKYRAVPISLLTVHCAAAQPIIEHFPPGAAPAFNSQEQHSARGEQSIRSTLPQLRSLNTLVFHLVSSHTWYLSFFSTDTIFGSNFLHTKARKSQQKKSRQNSVNCQKPDFSTV